MAVHAARRVAGGEKRASLYGHKEAECQAGAYPQYCLHGTKADAREDTPCYIISHGYCECQTQVYAPKGQIRTTIPPLPSVGPLAHRNVTRHGTYAPHFLRHCTDDAQRVHAGQTHASEKGMRNLIMTP
jgi:hypothetical protein